MITTFKSTKQVLVDPINLITDYVYLDISQVDYTGDNYSGIASYYYFVNDIMVQLQRINPVFTSAEIDIFAQGISEPTFTETFNAVIEKITVYVLGQGGYFGLTSADWELVPSI